MSTPISPENLNPVLDTWEPRRIIEWSVDTFVPRLLMTSSFGAESAVLIHLATRALPDIPIMFIDTGYLFAETHEFMTALQARFGLTVLTYRSKNDPQTYLRDAGELDPQNRVHISGRCAANKNEPFERAMRELHPSAWLRGIRADQTDNRRDRRVVEWSSRFNCYAISPLLHLSAEQIREYLRLHDLPVHPLVEEGYASIGCRPVSCTRPITLGESPRTGRWSGRGKTECGLHLEPPLPPAPPVPASALAGAC